MAFKDEARFYTINGRELPSVTTALQVINKPALGPWYAKEERRVFETAMLEVASRYHTITGEQLIETVIATVAQVKAGDKAKQAAGVIGTAAHAYIEWLTRRLLGEDAGPEPVIPEAAHLAVMAWQDWAKAVDFTPLMTERVVYCHSCGYAGTMDFLAKVEGVVTLGDYKCLLPDQTLLRPDGSTIRADEVMPGDTLLAWDGQRLVPDQVADVTPGGTQPAVEVITRYGRRLRVSANHPVLSGTRWLPAELLRADDPVVLGVQWPTPSEGGITTAEARLLGYLIGDGGLTHHHRRFTTTSEELLEDVTAICSAMGFTVTRDDMRPNKAPSYRIGGIGSFLRAHDIAGIGSQNKHIPAAVMSGTPEVARAFLTAYFDCDGWVSGPEQKTARVQYTTVSPRLAAETQELCWRFGIRPTIWRNENPTTPGADPWYVTTGNRAEVLKFCELLSDARLPKKRERLRHWASMLEAAPRSRVRQEAVAEVVPLGDHPTIAITMATHGTFITSGMVTHNTGKAIYPESFLQNQAYRHALLKTEGVASQQGLILRLPKTLEDPAFEAMIVPETSQADFLAALKLWQWQRRMQGKPTGTPMRATRVRVKVGVDPKTGEW